MTAFTMISHIKKEVCDPCKKFINIGQSLLECEMCFTAIHTKCYKNACFSSIQGIWACHQCSKNNMPPRYNPYFSDQTDSDKFYDDEGAFDNTVIPKICQVLENCKTYTNETKWLMKQNG